MKLTLSQMSALESMLMLRKLRKKTVAEIVGLVQHWGFDVRTMADVHRLRFDSMKRVKEDKQRSR
jgi:hypothetical protein